MLSAEPKLRTDLIISRQETKEGVFFVFKDPLTGRFFRFREAEYFIARQLDGSTRADLIRQRAEERFGSALALDTLTKFVESLGRIGLLESGEPRRGDATGKKRIRGSLLYLRYKAFDPDHLLNRLVGRLGLFFTPSFIGFSAFVVVCAMLITVLNWDQIAGDFRSLWRFGALLLAWLVVLLVTALHEFAHGLTCKHFGGEVHEMGFMLIYFQPAFYCNVSDAWLFPEKSKRLWVTFAGAYFEIFLWSLATLIWRMTEPETWVNFVALVIMTTSGIKTLFNLNPLIKLDGYYLFSDYLEIPNLRQKSIGYLRGLFKRLWRSAWQAPEASPRERRIYILYGLLAATYSYWLLSYIVLAFGNYLVERYQGVGAILFGGFLMALFGNSLRGLLCKAAAPLRGMQNRFGSRPIRILTVSAAFMAVLFLGRMELKVSGEFKVLPIHNSDVRAEVEGIIDEIYADEGDVVNKGVMIVRLSDRDPQAELRKITAEINEKRAKLKMLKAGTRREEIELTRMEAGTAKTRVEEALNYYQEAKHMRLERLSKAKAAVEKAKERVKYADQRLSMFKTLFTKQLISLKEFQEAEENDAVRVKELEEAEAELKLVLADDQGEIRKALKIAEKEIEEKQGKLKLLLAGSRPEEIEATEAEISRLEAQRQYTAEQLQLLRVLSPISGLITTPKLKEKLGQNVKKGDLIAQVHELKTIRAEISVSENEIADVQVGQEVVLKARAYPEKSFYGKISSVATTAIKGDNGQPTRTVLVTTQIDNHSFLLKPEMTGNAKIYCGRRSIIDLVTRRFVHYLRVEFWSWW
jgi:putative peptide zinc metalloprotease protein